MTNKIQRLQDLLARAKTRDAKIDKADVSGDEYNDLYNEIYDDLVATLSEVLGVPKPTQAGCDCMDGKCDWCVAQRR